MIESILKSFEVWSDAQGVKSKGRVKSIDNISLQGISRLRELILKFALQGKLTSYVSSDEPTIELLKRIDIERSYKIPNDIFELSDVESPYILPKGWEWVRLQRIIQISSGDGLTASQMNSNGKIPVFGGNGINGYHDKANILKPTLVIGRVGFYCGSVHITPSAAWVTDNAFITSFSEGNIDLKFLYWLLKGTNLKENENATAQPVISGRKIYPIIVGLPSITEQKRIVAKVEELMSLCDKLENQQAISLSTHQALVKTLLGTLSQAANADELKSSWEKILLNFDTLFCTDDSIEQLKQTILQLAIMGGIIKQYNKDEPSIELLNKITKEKEKLVQEGMIKKQTILPKITEIEKRFELPSNWCWCRLEDLTSMLGDGIHGTPNYDEDGEYYFINGNNLTDGKIEIKPETKTVSEKEFLKHKRLLNERTVLVSINGTIGNTAFYSNEKIILGKSACYFNLMNGIEKDFIRLLLTTKYFLEYAFTEATGTTIKNVSLKTMRLLIVPLPPFKEQQRIVTKVKELFELCDTLKIKIEKAQEIKILLSKTIVEYV